MWLEGEVWQEASPKQKRKLVEQDSFYRWPEPVCSHVPAQSCHHSGTSVLSSCSFCYYGVGTVDRLKTKEPLGITWEPDFTLSLPISPKELPCSSVPLPRHVLTDR